MVAMNRYEPGWQPSTSIGIDPLRSCASWRSHRLFLRAHGFTAIAGVIRDPDAAIMYRKPKEILEPIRGSAVATRSLRDVGLVARDNRGLAVMVDPRA